MRTALAAGLALAASALAAGCGAVGQQHTAAQSTAYGTTATTASTETKTSTTMDAGAPTVEADAIAVAGDGRIVVAGTDTTANELLIARFLPNGDPDRTFGTGGLVRTSDASSGNAVAILAGGKILAGGGTLVRYTSDGAVDASFGSGGRVEGAAGIANAAGTFALQHDGAIVVGGALQSPDPHQGFRIRLVRYTADGHRDAGFGANGTATAEFVRDPAFWNRYDSISKVLIGPDGTITTVGVASECGMCDASRFAAARFSPDGRLDRAFGDGGTVTTVVGTSYSRATSGALLPNGGIVLVGYRGDGEGPALASFTPDGQPDSTFGDDGQLMPEPAYPSDFVAVQSDGKIVTAGFWAGHVTVVRYGPNGKLDRPFGAGGRAVVRFGSGDEHARALAIQRDGKILVASENRARFVLARLTADGTPDPSFG